MARMLRRRAKEIHLPIWRRLGLASGASFLLLTALGILISGLLQYRAQDHLLRQSLGGASPEHRQNRRAPRGWRPAPGRGGFGPERHAHEYALLRSQLARIQETNQLGDPVYTLSHVQGGMARFAVISNGQEPVGKEYRLAAPIQPILQRVLDQGIAAYTDIYANEHGTWITALCPNPRWRRPNGGSPGRGFPGGCLSGRVGCGAAPPVSPVAGGCRPGPGRRAALGKAHHAPVGSAHGARTQRGGRRSQRTRSNCGAGRDRNARQRILSDDRSTQSLPQEHGGRPCSGSGGPRRGARIPLPSGKRHAALGGQAVPFSRPTGGSGIGLALARHWRDSDSGGDLAEAWCPHGRGARGRSTAPRTGCRHPGERSASDACTRRGGKPSRAVRWHGLPESAFGRDHSLSRHGSLRLLMRSSP